MFEYLYIKDFTPFILLWLTILLLSSSMNKKIKYIALYSGGLIFIILFLMNLHSSNVYSNNIELFNKDKTLECKVNKSKYLVKKSNQYSIKKDYFEKDGILIPIVDCEEF